MKTKISFIVLSILLFVGFSSSVKAQNLDQVASYIRVGSAAELSKMFQSNVEISLKESGNSYSKAQAEQVLINFFNKNTPKGFTIVHQGTSPEGSRYIIGNLVTTGGNYRVYVYAKPSGNTIVIREMRFESQ
jgi:hypothetical protein